jgi:hypothetical protein
MVLGCVFFCFCTFFFFSLIFFKFSILFDVLFFFGVFGCGCGCGRGKIYTPLKEEIAGSIRMHVCVCVFYRDRKRLGEIYTP